MYRAKAERSASRSSTIPRRQCDRADATLGEALFGLGRFDEARERLAVASSAEDLWRQETTATQLAALG